MMWDSKYRLVEQTKKYKNKPDEKVLCVQLYLGFLMGWTTMRQFDIDELSDAKELLESLRNKSIETKEKVIG